MIEHGKSKKQKTASFPINLLCALRSFKYPAVVIGSFSFSFGSLLMRFSEPISCHFRGRIVVETITAMIRTLRQDKIFRTAASNLFLVGRLGIESATKTKMCY